MGYKSLIDSNLSKAFILLKDLAEDVILEKSSEVAFDFSLGTLEEDTKITQLPIKAVVIEDQKKSDKVNSTERQLLFQTRGLDNLNAYDSVYIKDDMNPKKMAKWRFGPYLSNSGYIVLVKIHKEITNG